MELERELGFRSSFNFVPEGDYTTPSELRAELTEKGFEVGVHDLRHDGKLYRSKKEFLHAAERINAYLEEWNAAGFRSGFMHHKLDWLHALKIKYDMSTFDVDPFEPQPDGVHTIFPFWVEDQSRRADGQKRGYWELPYTLPQDFTVFTILGEKSIEIWKRKLDWIAEHGGMALLNVHPDYVSFSRAANGHFSADYYRDFLEYAASEYSGQFWNALPREIADFGSRKQISPKNDLAETQLLER
jgi:hypothetical protein